MDWLEQIYERLGDLISSFNPFNYLQYIYNVLVNIWNGITGILGYIASIFESLWYGLTTLLSGTYDIITSIFSSGLF